MIKCLPVALNDIDEVIGGTVSTQGDVGVEDLVLCQNALHLVTVQLTLNTLDPRRHTI
jgi:hypothetical protein